jgi:hypothetical protein
LEAEQQFSFDEIKRYLSLPPVMKATKVGILFLLYNAVEDSMIGAPNPAVSTMSSDAEADKQQRRVER